jgi:NADPH2:quinone reductase
MTAPSADSSTTRVTELVEPQPGPDEVAIEVEFAGVNFIDVMARRGDAGYASAWPYVAGLEVAGHIRAVGAGVDAARVGERVAAFTGSGGFARVALSPASLAVEIPSTVAFEAAAAAPLGLSSAVLLLEQVARVRSGDSVLMHSASGGLGSAVAQVAAALGIATRIGLVGDRGKVDSAVKAGWTHALAAGHEVAAAVGELVPHRVDVILDPGGTQHLEFDLEVAAPGARVVLFGNPSGATPSALPPMGRLIGGNVGILGFSISSLRRTRPERVADALRRGLGLLASGDVRPDVTIIDGLAAVPDVHDLMAARRGFGKYVVRLG